MASKGVKVAKYIYQYGDNLFKVSFHRTNKETNNKIDEEVYVNGTFDDALEMRTKLLSKHNLSLDKKKSDSTNGKSVKVDDYIYKLENGSYRVLIRKSKKIHKGYDKTFPTLELAIKKRDEFFAKYTLGYDEQSDITMEAFCEIFIDFYKNNKKSDSTIRTYNGNIQHDILPKFGKCKIKDIKTFELQEFILEQSNRLADNYNSKGKVITGNTVHHIYTTLRVIFNKAVAWKYIKENPLNGVEIPKFEVKESQIFELDDLKDVFEKIDSLENIKNKCIFNIALCAGMRESEIAGLHLDDIDFLNGTLSVNQVVELDFETNEYKEAPPKSKKSVRKIPVPNRCLDSIRLYLKEREKLIMLLKIRNPKYKEIPNVFFNKDGEFMRPKYIGKLWIKFRRKNNLPEVKFHGLRHTYCTIQANDNPDLSLSDVQYLMGHSSQVTTYVYMHKEEKNIKKATSIFDKIDNVDSSLGISIESIVMILTGRNIVDVSILMKEIGVLLNKAVNLFNLSDNLEVAKQKLLNNNPEFNNIIDHSKKYTDDIVFLKVIKSMFGNVYYFNDEIKSVNLSIKPNI